MNLVQKIICHNAVGLTKNVVKQGDIVVVNVARTLASEITEVGIEQTIRNLGVKKLWRNDRFFLALDHSLDPRNYHEDAIQKRIKACDNFVKDFQIKEYFGPNQSILHTEFYRQKATPGSIIIGSDSHSCSHGCVGALAIGMGASDTAMPLITGRTWLQVPEVILIEFVGKLSFGMVGKDLILHILKKYGRNTIGLQRVLEFGGNISNLSIDSRFAISNMATEFGSIAGVFPGDELTQEFIQKRKFKNDEIPYYFRADSNAEYAGKYIVNLEDVKPQVAKYPNPDDCYDIDDPKLYEPIYDNGKLVCDTILNLDGVFIGACTTTESEIILSGLLLEVLMDKFNMEPISRPEKEFHRILTPGSVIMSEHLEKIGILDIYRRAGFRIDAPGCSMCLGISYQKAQDGEIWLSSQNRNFRNRMGRGGIGNLASACSVAMSSFHMQITDPTDFYQYINKEKYDLLIGNKHTTDINITEPAPIIEDIKNTQITANKDQIIKNEEDIISGKVHIFGDNIDTDMIIPAPFIILRGKQLGKKSFRYYQPDFCKKTNDGYNIIVAGEGFGCGSSREEAVTCLSIAGIKAIIAKSFSFIFYRNLLTLNMLGIIIKDENFYNNLNDNSIIDINVSERKVILDNKEYPFTMTDIEETIYENGGVIGLYEKYKDNGFRELVQQSTVKTEKSGCGSGCSKDLLDW